MQPMMIVFWVVASIILGFIGSNRKFGFWGYFFCSMLLSPFIGIVIVLASDKRPPPV